MEEQVEKALEVVAVVGLAVAAAGALVAAALVVQVLARAVGYL